MFWFLLNIIGVQSLRNIGWYDGIHPPLKNFPWNLYTHIRYGAPIITPNGTALCNHTQMDHIVQLAHQKNVLVLWADNCNHSHVRFDQTPETYWNSIGSAVHECDIDGITVDYEQTGPLGIVTPKQSTEYSIWLSTLRKAIQKPVGADISLPGIAPGNWVLGWLPWVNVSMVNNGDFDWISSMSYHWAENGEIWAWEKDVWVLTQLWKIQPEKINLGLPLFSKRWNNITLIEEPTWASLSSKCPNIAYTKTSCDDVLIVSKQMAFQLGSLVAKHHLGGFFPWEASYDSYEWNNSIVPYLWSGFNASKASAAKQSSRVSINKRPS